MAEYIDRAAIMRKIEEESREWGEEYDTEQILGDIEDFPAADVVEVVRCKDCINHHDGGTCDGWSRYGTIQTPDDAYCSWGVRRGG